jgi:hypothetical protein
MRSQSFLAIALSLLSTQVFSSENSFYQQFKLGAGSIEVVGQNSETCADGPFQIMGEKDEEVLMVGPVITFPLKGETTKSEGCTEVSEVKIGPQKITSRHTISACPPKNKKLESTVTETLVSNGTTITYERSDKIKCIFKWTALEKN